MEDLPYLLTGHAPLAGVCKVRWENFRVVEIPAVEPEGRGDHTWIEIEKSGLTTATAAADIARALVTAFDPARGPPCWLNFCGPAGLTGTGRSPCFVSQA